MFTQQLTQRMGIWAAPLAPANRAGNTNVNVNGWIVGPVNMGIVRRAFGLLNVGAILGAGAANTCNMSFLAGNTTTFVSLIQDAGYLGVGGPLTASADPAATVAILACNSGGTITLGDPNEIAVAMVFNYGGIANTTTATLICHDVNVYLTALNGAASIC